MFAKTAQHTNKEVANKTKNFDKNYKHNIWGCCFLLSFDNMPHYTLDYMELFTWVWHEHEAFKCSVYPQIVFKTFPMCVYGTYLTFEIIFRMILSEVIYIVYTHCMFVVCMYHVQYTYLHLNA